MEKTNKFYMANSNKIPNDKDVEKIKKTNIFIIYTLKYILDNKGVADNLGANHLDPIRNITLPRVANINKLLPKLRFLVLSLYCKKGETPSAQKIKNREIFINSPIAKCVIEPLASGYAKEEDKNGAWDNYFSNGNSDDKISEMSLFDAGLECLRRSDRSMPIGLNLANIIDTVVKTDSNGQYYLDDKIDDETKDLLLDATTKQLQDIKNCQRFKNNFYYTQKDNENSSEDDE